MEAVLRFFPKLMQHSNFNNPFTNGFLTSLVQSIASGFSAAKDFTAACHILKIFIIGFPTIVGQKSLR